MAARYNLPRVRAAAVLAALSLSAAACARDDAARPADSAVAARADTSGATGLTPAAPAPPPTAKDANVVRDALEFRLTRENLAKFTQAGNRLAFLRARDSQVRGYLESLGGTRGGDDDSALERLERHAQIRQAIADAGLSVRDYYTMTLAIASARRFIDNPEAAPPTPTLSENARLLRDNPQLLAQLRVWGQ